MYVYFPPKFETDFLKHVCVVRFSVCTKCFARRVLMHHQLAYIAAAKSRRASFQSQSFKRRCSTQAHHRSCQDWDREIYLSMCCCCFNSLLAIGYQFCVG